MGFLSWIFDHREHRRMPLHTVEYCWPLRTPHPAWGMAAGHDELVVRHGPTGRPTPPRPSP
ncbi:hypothetical protein [Streptomyces noursei]|uniref:hypothetical protein n=1 Tax=Streptomyces noursei TaxID=1971 RepID=UPI001E6116A4|nr:hypothetical protein [Streptomyces noursei]MCZ1020849.1 hypothetical protein [Streptomyces noursei]